VKKVISTVKPDYIFHLSGFVNGLRDVNYVPVAFNSLLASTVNILTVATQAGCERVVLTGSQEEPEKEKSFPGSPYAAAKWACRSYAKMFDKLYGISVLNPRIFMVYGPEQKDYRKLIPYVILSLLNNETPKLTNGTRPVDWIYVEDVVDALIQGAVSDLTIDMPFDIGSGIQITVKEIVEKIVSIMGSEIRPTFGYHAPRPFERIVSADINNTILRPKVEIVEGLTRTIAWYKENFKKIINSSHYVQRKSG
jgi:nucleoside-diphosphate-sugar epimerase